MIFLLKFIFLLNILVIISLKLEWKIVRMKTNFKILGVSCHP